jgi:hypothetical protein
MARKPSFERAVYVNNLGAEGHQRVHSAYGDNLARLASVRHTYDPTNFFRHNQNIPPSVREQTNEQL